MDDEDNDSEESLLFDFRKTQIGTQFVVGQINGDIDGSLDQLVAGITPPKLPLRYTPYNYALSRGAYIGGAEEMGDLSSWASSSEYPVKTIVGLGGMGKSRFVWEWLNNKIEEIEQPFDGVMWWSFYEENSEYEIFLIHALAYFAQKNPAVLASRSVDANCRDLISCLNANRFLICLDGLERIMHGYRQFDIGQSAVDLSLTQNGSAEKDLDAVFLGHNTPEMERSHFRFSSGKAGLFLRQICQLQKSKILITSRLRPAEFEKSNQHAVPGVLFDEMHQINENHVLELFYDQGVIGDSRCIIEIAQSVDFHPLTLLILAGEVGQKGRRSNMTFEEWIENNSGFSPSSLSIVQRKSHILYFALRGLRAKPLVCLASIAAFRGPAGYEDLLQMLVGTDQLFTSAEELDNSLDELEDRHLIGWNNYQRSFDMHPIIRGVIWKSIGESHRSHIANLHKLYFTSSIATSGSDPFFAVQQHFFSLCELNRYDEAYELVKDRITDDVIVNHRTQVTVSMLEALCRNGNINHPNIKKEGSFFIFYRDLAFSHSYCGRPDQSLRSYVTFLKGKTHIDNYERFHLLANIPLILLNYGFPQESRQIFDLYFKETDDPKEMELRCEFNGYDSMLRGDMTDAFNSFYGYLYGNLAIKELDMCRSEWARFTQSVLQTFWISRKINIKNDINIDSIISYALYISKKHSLSEMEIIAELSELMRRLDLGKFYDAELAKLRALLQRAPKFNTRYAHLNCLDCLLEVFEKSERFSEGAQVADELEAFLDVHATRSTKSRMFSHLAEFWASIDESANAVRNARQAVYFGSQLDGNPYCLNAVESAQNTLRNEGVNYDVVSDLYMDRELNAIAEAAGTILRSKVTH